MARSALTAIQRKILCDVLGLPTAPFAEHFVLGYIDRFCRQRPEVTVARDRAANLLLHVQRGRRRIDRPVCLTAHTDHPGFVAERMIGKRRLRAQWRGGVPPEYFRDSAVRFFVDGDWVRGTVRSVKTVKRFGRTRVETATVDVPADVPTGSIGMWDFPDPRMRGTRTYARGCDDLAGVAGMLCAIDELTRQTASCDAYFLFTRAEEVGFVGAMAAARLRTIPPKCYVVGIETSSQLPSARTGDGPILRVGDRASTFSHEATAYCHQIARDLAAAHSTFRFQRKLMDGGTCESSAYCALGYEATGICLALGNYHNIDAKQQKLAPEYIDVRDLANAVKWFVELARAPRPYTGRDALLQSQLQEYDQAYRTLLHASREQAC